VVTARAADAIALAVYAGATVYAWDEVLDQAGVQLPDQTDVPVPPRQATWPGQAAGVPAWDAFAPVQNMALVEVTGVRQEVPSNQPIVLLKESYGQRYLPIRIPAVEAMAIFSALNGPQREDPPLTHELLGAVLNAVGVQHSYTMIAKIAEGYYFCELILSDGTRVQAAAGDSIALALRTGAAIALSAALLDADGVEIPG
jgi:uncharacterized protein